MNGEYKKNIDQPIKQGRNNSKPHCLTFAVDLAMT